MSARLSKTAELETCSINPSPSLQRRHVTRRVASLSGAKPTVRASSTPAPRAAAIAEPELLAAEFAVFANQPT
jgi:hypothetical protein